MWVGLPSEKPRIPHIGRQGPAEQKNGKRMNVQEQKGKVLNKIQNYGSLLKVVFVVAVAVVALCYSVYLLIQLYKLYSKPSTNYEPIRKPAQEAEQSSPNSEAEKQVSPQTTGGEGTERIGALT